MHLTTQEYLPEDNLVYFLTQYEISQLLGGKTSIVTKAIRRRKLYPSQMGRRYPVFNIGTPQPVSYQILNETCIVSYQFKQIQVKGQTREENSGSLQMQGMQWFDIDMKSFSNQLVLRHACKSGSS